MEVCLNLIANGYHIFSYLISKKYRFCHIEVELVSSFCLKIFNLLHLVYCKNIQFCSFNLLCTQLHPCSMHFSHSNLLWSQQFYLFKQSFVNILYGSLRDQPIQLISEWLVASRCFVCRLKVISFFCWLASMKPSIYFSYIYLPYYWA